MNAMRILLLSSLLLASWAIPAFSASNEWSDNSVCMTCHSDKDLKSENGRKMFVAGSFDKSVHGSLSCVDCHTAGNYDDAPHYKKYQPVNCDACHTGLQANWQKSVHGRAGGSSPFLAARCVDCHSTTGDGHSIMPTSQGASGHACTKCHAEETKKFFASRHSKAFPKLGKRGECATCHPAHGETKLNDPVAITRTCQSCHTESMEKLRNGPHGIHGLHTTKVDSFGNKVSCSSCHDAHGIPDPKKSNDAFSNCINCHRNTMAEFSGSVHQAKLVSNEMTCASCHSVHLKTNEEAFHCGNCHTKQEEQYRKSMHFKDDPTGLGVAANCGDCHDRGHGVRRISDHRSMANPRNQPITCGKCHGDSVITTSDYVRMPMTQTNYMKSIHADKWREWSKDSTKSRGAICSDCHTAHEVQSAGNSQSLTYRQNLPSTCGKCHDQAATDYLTSIHGAAARRGIMDSPACNNCHESHMILSRTNPASRTYPTNVAADCGTCHNNPALTQRFGIWQGVIGSYEDSYHGWALKSSMQVANCNSCHTPHAIRSHLDPRSTTHANNVVQTCGKCHPNSNTEFAASYSHEAFGKKKGYHDYARVIYLFLILGTLGGMLAHNIIIYAYYLRIAKRKHLQEAYIVRMDKTEKWQHIVLLFTFSGLAFTGLALRYPDSWWVHALAVIGMDESIRALAHRLLAVTLVLGTFWHAIWLLTTRRGFTKLLNYLPRISDVRPAIDNVLFHLGMRKQPPVFETYDYTQKAEYWALVWGTFVMGITGAILWFPALITSWAPGWIVRVASVVHYYEAILAVGAIIIWHFFFVILHPQMYPLSFTFLTGRLSLQEWKHHHGKAAAKSEGDPDFVKPGDPTPEPDESHHE